MKAVAPSAITSVKNTWSGHKRALEEFDFFINDMGKVMIEDESSGIKHKMHSGHIFTVCSINK
jgi:hypothetical protein